MNDGSSGEPGSRWLSNTSGSCVQSWKSVMSTRVVTGEARIIPTQLRFSSWRMMFRASSTSSP
ncbi:hypothetical protein D3C87_1826930 [compost metagenome]